MWQFPPPLPPIARPLPQQRTGREQARVGEKERRTTGAVVGGGQGGVRRSVEVEEKAPSVCPWSMGASGPHAGDHNTEKVSKTVSSNFGWSNGGSVV